MSDPVRNIDPPESERGLEMLSAAHLLLSSDRLTDERDLLISTCLEALDSGPASSAALARTCNEIWPATSISIEAVRMAMSEAAELGLVAIQETLGGHDWVIASTGRTEIESTRTWFSDAMNRLARQIQDRARDDFGDVSSEIALNWARVLLRLFTTEIARSASSYAGEVERGAAGPIRPMILDGRSMLHALDGLALPPGTTDFLKGCLLAAVDESDPFGNELVGQVATSCVLHAIAARRGRAAAQEALGSLAGQRIVLDTPIFMDLLNSDGTERRLQSLIKQAVALGMEVIAPEHVLEELADVIQRVTDEHVANLTSGLSSGVSPWAYAQIVSEQVLELFLDGVRNRRYRNWNDFTERARELRSELSALGVVVRQHQNKNRSNVNLIQMHLTENLRATESGRSAKAIARDAESAEMVWRARRRESESTLWPGGWLVSHDRHIGPSYARANRNDPEPLVLTPAQWATLMTEAAPPANIPDLVQSAASYLRQETMLRIATKYPPAVALTLARTLSGKMVSGTDLRVAQTTLGDLLERAADGKAPSGERLASELAARRAERLAAAGREQIDLAALERARLDDALTKTTAVVSEEQDKRKAAEDRADSLAASNALAARRTVFVGVLVGVTALGIVFGLLNFWWLVTGTAIALITFVILGSHWLREPKAKFWLLLWSVVPEVLGLIDLASRFDLLRTK